MIPSRSRVIALLAISAWPALNFIATNWDEVERGGLQCLAGVVVITMFLWIVGYGLYQGVARRRGDDLIAMWVVVICASFGYFAARNFFIYLFVQMGVIWPPSVAWFLFTGAALFVTWRWRRSERLQIAATTFSIVAAGAATVALAVAAVQSLGKSTDAGPSGNAPSTAHAVRADLDIYYILLDAYAGERSLREALSYDNSAFMARMAARGFRDVSTGRSNYLRTMDTLAGIFSLQYPHTEDPGTWKDWRRLYPGLLDATQPPALIARLKADGYAVWFSGSVVGGCPPAHVRCLGNTARVDSLYMAQAFLAPTPIGRVLRRTVDRRRYVLQTLEANLPAMLAGRGPRFVFAHHLAPHAPYLLDRECHELANGPELTTGTAEQQRGGYLGALECVNTQVEKLLDRIIGLDPQALVVVQGDHGSGLFMDWEKPMASWSDAAIRERASYLNLVRAPESCARRLARPMGQINTARFVLACAESREPDYLPEHTYLSTYSRGAEEGMVREWRPAGDQATR